MVYTPLFSPQVLELVISLVTGELIILETKIWMPDVLVTALKKSPFM